jgi:aminopeptidase-like protein
MIRKSSYPLGDIMYHLAKNLFKLNRSLTGEGVRETLNILREIVPIEIKSIQSSSQVFDWTVPKEWVIRNAWIITPSGTKICDFFSNNLHLVGYSVPINARITRKELEEHLHSLPDQPDAIPYITSYYKEYWGFCLSHNERLTLEEGIYEVFIDSELIEGVLNYADLVIPGKSTKEILFSTYICHPSMANNELSGPVLAVELAKMLLKTENEYTYRFVFVPETIGSLVYLSKHLNHLKHNVIAGYVLTCVGDDNAVSYLESRYGNTYADKVARFALDDMKIDYKHYSFLERGSDERQYCAPGIDLPVCSVMRSKYGTYPEYHTSLDNLNYISPQGLQLSYDIYIRIIDVIENNKIYIFNVLGEPQLGKRGLYPNISSKDSGSSVRDMMNIITYLDGSNDLIDIILITGVNYPNLKSLTKILIKNNLIKESIKHG